MKLSIISFRSLFVAYAAFGLVALASGVARAESTVDASSPAAVSCVSGQFGDHIEQGKVVGDAEGILAAKKAVYWVDIANAGEPTQVTLVWTLDGREAQRQTLDVGTSPHWHTWAMRPLGNAHKVNVEVLDASGRSLRVDSL
jgi:hypothetical protein